MIDSKEKQVLADLIAIMKLLDLPMILVGAGARLLIFDQKFEKGRGTKDWDIAVSLDSWQDYQILTDALIKGSIPKFEATRNSHKFIHVETKIEVDIVPFGQISEPKQEIIWPDDNVMNVLGFTEALANAKTENIDDLEIQVVDIPAFIVLKVFAWGDRGGRTKKDLEDLELVLSKYEDDERVYVELAEELTTGDVDFSDANIYLLGQDIYKIFQPKTIDELKKVLNKLINMLGSDNNQSLGYKLVILMKGINSKALN